MSGFSDYSEAVDTALRGGRGRKRNASNALGGGAQGLAVLAPVLLHQERNPLLAHADGSPIAEEFTYLEGDVAEAKLWEDVIHHSDPCVCCNHQSCTEHKVEFDRIIDLDEQNYGLRSDAANFEYITDEYRKEIFKPTTLQNNAKKNRGSTDIKEIPDLTPVGAAKHFLVDAILPYRELGSDIRVTKMIQNRLRFKGIQKLDGGVDENNAKLWMLFSKHKKDLVKTYSEMYPNLTKRQKKNPFEGTKPTGAK